MVVAWVVGADEDMVVVEMVVWLAVEAVLEVVGAAVVLGADVVPGVATAGKEKMNNKLVNQRHVCYLSKQGHFKCSTLVCRSNSIHLACSSLQLLVTCCNDQNK